MNDQIGPGNLLDTTDSLEAVGVFRGWKNFMFLIVLVCLLVLQGAFWLVNTDSVQIEPEGEGPSEAVAAAVEGADANEAAGVAESNDVTAGVEADTADTAGAEAEPEPRRLGRLPIDISFETLSWVIEIANTVLIISSMLYVLTVVFSLKVSLIGKLGGINHISRAFFLSMIMFILLLPWQKVAVFEGMVMGAIYTPCELAKAFAQDRTEIFDIVLFYLRFSGFWLLIFLLLLLSQLRTCRWTRAILRRLEVV